MIISLFRWEQKKSSYLLSHIKTSIKSEKRGQFFFIFFCASGLQIFPPFFHVPLPWVFCLWCWKPEKALKVEAVKRAAVCLGRRNRIVKSLPRAKPFPRITQRKNERRAVEAGGIWHVQSSSPLVCELNHVFWPLVWNSLVAHLPEPLTIDGSACTMG